jgi:hypothetical protein
MVGFGLGGAMIKSRPEDVSKVKDLRNIKELYGKMGKILGAPQGENFSDEMSGLLYGFSDNFFTKDFATLGLNEMDRLLNVKDAFDEKKKLQEEGKTEEEIASLMPQEQLALLDTYKQLQEIQAGTRANFGTAIGEGLQQMIPFIAQFAATGGVGASAKEAVKQFVKSKTKSTIAGRIAGAIAKPLTQAAVMIPAELQNYAQRVAPTMDAHGNLIEGQDEVNAAFKAYLTTVAEVAGEDVGVFTNKIANKSARKNFAKLIANDASKSQQFLGKLSLALTRETNVPGVQGFVFEGIGEEATGVMQAALDQDGNFFTMEAQKQVWALSLMASGTFASMSIPGRIKTRTQYGQAKDLLNDIPNSSYTSAVENVSENYTDPEESIGALDEISKDFEISQEDYLKARNFIAKSARYNQMNTARAIQVEERIAQSVGSDGNVTLTQVDGQIYSVRNPQDLGPGNENKVIYLKDKAGNIKPVISSKISQYETKSPDTIKEEQIGQQDIQDDAINEEQQAQEEAEGKGLIEGKTVNTPNGKRTLVSVNPDGTSTVQTNKGEQEVVNTDEIEAYKTQEQKDAEKVEAEADPLMEGIDEGAEVVSDEPLTEDSEIRVIDFSNGQSKIITPEGEQVFNNAQDRDQAIQELVSGEIEAAEGNIDELPPEQAFAEMRKEDPEIAAELFTEEINDMKAQAEQARAEVKETQSRQEKKDLLIKAKQLESEAIRLEGILADPTVLDEVVEEEIEAPAIQEEVIDEVAEPIEEEVSEEQRILDQADVLNAEYLQEQESAPINKLLPWQIELLATKVNRESFFDNSDQNFDTPLLRRSWFNKKGTETSNSDIDRVAQDLSEGLDREITVQEVVDFILENPNRNVRKTTDRMNEIQREYKELTGKSIKKHSELRSKLGLEAPIAEQAEVEGFEQPADIPFRTDGVNVSDQAEADVKSRQNAIKELNKLQSKFGIPVEVINSNELSPEAKAKARQVGSPKAFYQNGTVYIISDQITSVSDVKKSYLHEALLHKGLDLVFESGPVTLLGKTYESKNDLLDDVFRKMDNKTIEDRANVYYPGTPIDQLTESQQREIAEEALATLSETESPRVQVMMDKLYNFIKKLFGFTSKQFTKADLRNMLSEHRELIISQKKSSESSPIGS